MYQESEQEKLRYAVGFAQKAFELVSGFGKFESRICAYYCIATWHMEQINPFPSLTLTGPQGTGKTSALRAFNGMAFRPVMFNASKITDAVLRDKLHDADHGTAIIDEADKSDECDVEVYLIDRYLQETAFSAKKIPLGGHLWATEDIPIWGATILHKRQPYKDPAVESRSITVSTSAHNDRRYSKAEKLEPLFAKVRKLAETCAGIKLDKEPSEPEGYQVAGRVSDTYRPILLIAEEIADTDFLTELWDKIQAASLDLREGQTYEPGPLLLQGLIALLVVNGKFNPRPVRIEGELLKWLRDVHGKIINAWQAAKILRSYGLTVKRIGGPNNVVIDDIKAFIEICRKQVSTTKSLKKRPRSRAKLCRVCRE